MNNSGHLCITGSVYSKKTAPAGNEFGIINNSGDLSIRGDLKFSFPNHRINMTDEGAVLKIGGDASLYSTYCNITAGKVIFNGTEQQTISGLRAGHIILENESEFGVVLSTSISPNLLFDHRGNNFTLKSGGTFVDYDGDGLKDNVDPYPTIGNPCTITVQSCDVEKGSVSVNHIETVGGTSHTVTAEPTFKYAFSKWTDETGKVLSTDSEYIVVAKKDTTLTAVFEKRTQPVTIQIAEGGTINVPIFAPIEETLEIPIIENDGYVFCEGSLMYNGIPVVHGQFIMPDEPVIITAEFERNDNYFALLDGITEAKAVSGDGYSAKSFASLQEVIAAAEESLANAVSAEVSRYYVGRLQQCIEELQTRYIVGLSVKAAGVLYWNAPEQIEKITIEVAYDNGTSKDIKGLDCSISGYDSTNYEPQIITVTYNGFSANLSVTVRKVPIASVLYEAIPAQLFYGSAVTPVPTLTSRYNEGTELVCGEDFKVKYTNNNAIGIGRVTITGIGNYQGTRSLTFKIECEHIYDEWLIDTPAMPDSVGYRHHTCSICGDIETEEIPQVPSLKFDGASLTLQSDLKVNFVVKKDLIEKNGYENPYAVFSMNGDEITVSNYTVNGDYYVFSFSNIAPDKMNDTITATLHATYDGVEYAGMELKYSIAQYCYSMLDRESSEEKLHTLLVDLLQYGSASQIYTGYHTDALAAASLNEEQLSWGTVEDPVLTSVTNTEFHKIDFPSVMWRSASLNLNDSIAMQFAFTTKDINDITVKVENEAGILLQEFSSEELTAAGGKHIAKINKLTASQMGETVYVTAYRGGVAASNTLSYSVESYACAKQNDSNEKLANLVKAMMKYGNSAYAYTQ